MLPRLVVRAGRGVLIMWALGAAFRYRLFRLAS
jgi:hypothetical protein